MKRITLLATLAIAVFAFSSCKAERQMLLDADKVTVQSSQNPLAVKGGKVQADLAINFPRGYFNSKAVMEITPVIVYAGGEAVMDPIKYQGDRVKNNYRVVRHTGSNISQHVLFDYAEGMAESHLELRARYSIKKDRWINLPTKKVADGCNITETLADVKGTYTYKDHGYQSVIIMNPEGQVMYNINSSVVDNKEFKSQSIKDFKAKLGEMTLDERAEITGIQVVAYASPEGKESFNNKLSKNRSKTGEQAFEKVAKGEELTGVRKNVISVGEDWEGFQEMVQKSDMEDKDLILRVLSMYDDPKVREREIRNMASIFTDLASDVLPQLRRARFIATVEYTNYTDEELIAQIGQNLDVLDESALLKAASLSSNADTKNLLYKKAEEAYGSTRATFNRACVAVDGNDYAAARTILAKCDQNDADVINLLGVIYFREGNVQKAEQQFIKSGSADAQKNLGMLALVDGRYSDAIIKCGATGVNAALARLLSGNLDDALKCIAAEECPVCDYLRAIIYNRKGMKSEATAALAKAKSASAELAARSEKDLEFVNLR